MSENEVIDEQKDTDIESLETDQDIDSEREENSQPETEMESDADSLAESGAHEETGAHEEVESDVANESEEQIVDRTLSDQKLKNILEATLMAIGKPMSMEQLMKLFEKEERPSASRVKDQLNLLQEECEGRGVELKEVANGYRYQARQEYSDWLSRLWEEKPAKYSRAYLETLALIAYRQPVTRAEIEEVRGVSVSSHIIKTMLEREWIRVVGHRDVPGRPSLYATTKQFLDYFNMKSLDELPSLAEIKDLDDLNPELQLEEPGVESIDSTQEAEVTVEDLADALGGSEEQQASDALAHGGELGDGPELETGSEFDSESEQVLEEGSTEEEQNELNNPQLESATLLGESEQDAASAGLDEFKDSLRSGVYDSEDSNTANETVEETINELLHQGADIDTEDSSAFGASEHVHTETQPELDARPESDTQPDNPDERD
ncbi:MAG: SMC-Scp complex subunit ScpB [Kangiellaceae bacterium]|nr:SMC-Scp complex subunit ScpB [Kangiellaceae bacterium]MCW8997776.1 SMC-Scp complex subunit ScpB [Kangiellaceae bacterium]